MMHAKFRRVMHADLQGRSFDSVATKLGSKVYIERKEWFACERVARRAKAAWQRAKQQSC
jgi:hypothetical protein